jgi:hypothetical protein
MMIKAVKYSLCMLVLMGLASAAHAHNNDREKPSRGKVQFVKKEKKSKAPIVCQDPRDPTGVPFSVPDTGSTALLLGLSALAVAGLAQRKRAIES